jgi:hypothetical protein
MTQLAIFLKKYRIYCFSKSWIIFLEEVRKIKVNRVGQLVSLHKPLLLLLTIGKVYNGHKNHFLFDELEYELTSLISKYGLKKTSKVQVQYPFIYLASNSSIWTCSKDKNELAHPDAASRKELLGSTGSFSHKFYNFLLDPTNLFNTVELLLNQYWPDAYHTELLNDVGIYNFCFGKALAQKNVRGRKLLKSYSMLMNENVQFAINQLDLAMH